MFKSYIKYNEVDIEKYIYEKMYINYYKTIMRYKIFLCYSSILI